jgi:hypothetical protein
MDKSVISTPCLLNIRSSCRRAIFLSVQVLECGVSCLLAYAFARGMLVTLNRHGGASTPDPCLAQPFYALHVSGLHTQTLGGKLWLVYVLRDHIVLISQRSFLIELTLIFVHTTVYRPRCSREQCSLQHCTRFSSLSRQLYAMSR